MSLMWEIIKKTIIIIMNSKIKMILIMILIYTVISKIKL